MSEIKLGEVAYTLEDAIRLQRECTPVFSVTDNKLAHIVISMMPAISGNVKIMDLCMHYVDSDGCRPEFMVIAGEQWNEFMAVVREQFLAWFDDNPRYKIAKEDTVIDVLQRYDGTATAFGFLVPVRETTNIEAMSEIVES